jgi:hypothetical protein
MRTTLALDDDAIAAIKAFGRGHRLSLGKAASELIRRGCRYQLAIKKIDGFPVFDAPPDFPAVTTERIRELLDEECPGICWM